MDNIKDTEIQHILVIDDDERLRLLLRRFLEESGFRVTDVASAGDARRLLGGIAFDLLIIDIMMPGETGLEFLTDLRKDSEVPALFLTAMAETEHRITGLESGADDYMSKPFEPRELVLRIRSILARAAARPRQTGSSIGFGPYSFDPATGVLMHSSGRIHITTAEQKLWQALPRVLTRYCRERISQQQWTVACVAVQSMWPWPVFARKSSPTPAFRSISRRSGTRAGCCEQTIRQGA